MDRFFQHGADAFGEDVADPVQELVSVFAMVRDKDVFLRYYWVGLSRRMLMRPATAAVDEAEAVMLGCFARVCGADVTRSMYRMLADMPVSAGLSREFQAFRQAASFVLPTEHCTRVFCC